MRRLDYKYVKNGFEKEGYTLVSDCYINAKTKLNYICPEGHEHSTAWGNWKTGHRCPNCITLCKTCHKEVHKNKGCNYNDLKCNNTNKGENSYGHKY